MFPWYALKSRLSAYCEFTHCFKKIYVCVYGIFNFFFNHDKQILCCTFALPSPKLKLVKQSKPNVPDTLIVQGNKISHTKCSELTCNQRSDPYLLQPRSGHGTIQGVKFYLT